VHAELAVDPPQVDVHRLLRDGELRGDVEVGVAGQSTHAVLPIGAPPGTPCSSFVGIMGAMAIDHVGALYVSLASCDPASRGVWKVEPSGATRLLAALPIEALPNGAAYRDGHVFVPDSALGLVWRIPKNGGLAEVWSADPLLAVPPGAIFPGPNGGQFFRGELYVSVPATLTIVAIRMRPDGSAGAARTHAMAVGCDDFAFDVFGSLYCGTDPFNTAVKVAQDGTTQVILTKADGLDGPSATVFGRRHGEELVLYVTNAAFPFFYPETGFRPSLMRVRLGVPGLPRP
jgi:hypothetical protein